MNGIVRAQVSDTAARRRLAVLNSGASIAIALLLPPGNPRDAFMVVATVVAGADIALRAIRGILRKQVTIELLVMIAASGALVIGEYWESAAVSFLFVFGAWLEARTLNRTRESLAKLLEIAPTIAVVTRDGKYIEVDPVDVEPGEHVLVRSGMKLPVDGVVVQGTSAVDESAITGESIPVEKLPGDPVYAGTVSHDCVLTIEAQGIGADTTLARIIHRVEEAQESRAPAQKTIERFAAWYTPAIMTLASVTWILTRDTHLALTILVIGCPGALVIATPVAFVAGIGRAANLGILVKGGEFLETVSKVTTVAFDKTGTLTHGRPELTDVVVLTPVRAGGTDSLQGSDDVLRFAAIAEAGSSHPLARPIVDAAQDRIGTIPQASLAETIPGHGVLATWEHRRIAVGTPAFINRQGMRVDPEALEVLDRVHSDGKTAMLVAIDDEVHGVIGVQDMPREDAALLPDRLQHAGVH